MRKKKIIVARSSGFCFGVKRAVDIAEEALKRHKKIYSFGPIIHNPQVVAEFSRKGLKIKSGIKRANSKKSVFLIPSHGISPVLLKKIKAKCIDTTCPLVARVQNTVKNLKKKGYLVIIVGNKRHPEVKALKGIAGKKAKVFKGKEDALRLKPGKNKIAVVSQTTAPVSDFKNVLSEIARKNPKKLFAINTVCKNTIERRKEAVRIAAKSDGMLVVGGKESANTSKLAKACAKVNKNTRHIESAQKIQKNFLKGKNTIGIATGASTPIYAIDEVITKIKEVDS